MIPGAARPSMTCPAAPATRSLFPRPACPVIMQKHRGPRGRRSMIQRAAKALPELYEADETAWLETMADLIRAGKYKELDYLHLGEYLSDMARRDRREV